MKTVLKFGALLAMALIVQTASAADDLAAGKVKSVDADAKKFVLTDPAGTKDWTFGFGDKCVTNRGGQEGKGDLKVGDAVFVHYDKGVVNWTAKYILVQEGDAMTWTMAHGSFKGYDAAKKQFTFTDPNGTDVSYAVGDGAIRLNNKKAEIGELKIGDHVLVIMAPATNGGTLKHLIAERQ